MQLFLNTTSPFARVARVIVLEKGLTDRVDLVWSDPWGNDPALLAAHPQLRIPVLMTNDGHAIAESLLESELFGYDEGAFTGARRGGHAGLFEAANRGTLFLDEIGEMPLNLQTRLLRVLEEREIVRVGGVRPAHIKDRIRALGPTVRPDLTLKPADPTAGDWVI